MHDYDNVFQYRGSGGKVLSWSESDAEDAAGAFYHEIFQVNARSGPIYLAVSTFVGSTSQRGESIRAIRIDGSVLDTDAKLIRTGAVYRVPSASDTTSFRNWIAKTGDSSHSTSRKSRLAFQ
jgi:hypothetical protein